MAPLRTAAARLFVELRKDKVVVTGPHAALKLLATQREKPSVRTVGVRAGP